MATFSGGFLRDTSGGLVTVDVGSAAAPTQIGTGFLRDATGALVTTSSTTGYATGYARDSAFALTTVDVGSAVSPTMTDGFMRAQGGAIVTVAEGSAVAPTGYATGFLVDANRSLVVTSSGGGSAIAFVRAGGNANTASTVSTLAVTVPAAGHAAGNILFVAIGTGQATVATPSSVTDSKLNTYTIDNTTVATVAVTIARSTLTTPLVSGDTITAHWAATAALLTMDTAEFSGVAASPLDQAVANTGTASTTLDGGTTLTLAQAIEVAFGAFMAVGSTGGSTAGAGWTKLNDITVGTAPNRGFVWEYQVTNSTAAIDSTATIVTAHSYSGLTTTYKAA
jgi:hypothetical protein